MILLFLAWVVSVTHRVLNNYPPTAISFPYSKATTDIQWYVLDIGQMVSVLLILVCFALYIMSGIKKDENIFILILTLLIVQLLDIVHYVLWFKQSEIMFFCENAIIITGIILTVVNNGRKNKIN